MATEQTLVKAVREPILVKHSPGKWGMVVPPFTEGVTDRSVYFEVEPVPDGYGQLSGCTTIHGKILFIGPGWKENIFRLILLVEHPRGPYGTVFLNKFCLIQGWVDLNPCSVWGLGRFNLVDPKLISDDEFIRLPALFLAEPTTDAIEYYEQRINPHPFIDAVLTQFGDRVCMEFQAKEGADLSGKKFVVDIFEEGSSYAFIFRRELVLNGTNPSFLYTVRELMHDRGQFAKLHLRITNL